ncbi:MAG: hypothetical protein R3A46_18305 [Thermomicrobiales bacterium]
MVASTYRDAAVAESAPAKARSWRMPGLRFIAILLALITAGLTADALIEPVAPFDVPLTNAIQRIDAPGLSSVLHAVEQLTSSEGAIAAWLVAMTVFIVARAWLPALAVMVLPVGGVLNEGLGEFIVQRTRPNGAEHDIARSLPDIDAPLSRAGTSWAP